LSVCFFDTASTAIDFVCRLSKSSRSGNSTWNCIIRIPAHTHSVHIEIRLVRPAVSSRNAVRLLWVRRSACVENQNVRDSITAAIAANCCRTFRCAIHHICWELGTTISAAPDTTSASSLKPALFEKAGKGTFAHSRIRSGIAFPHTRCCYWRLSFGSTRRSTNAALVGRVTSRFVLTPRAHETRFMCMCVVCMSYDSCCCLLLRHPCPHGSHYLRPSVNAAKTCRHRSSSVQIICVEC
jgi:hypothetical protein